MDDDLSLLTAAVMSLARDNIMPHVHELLVAGDPDANVRPGALERVVEAAYEAGKRDAMKVEWSTTDSYGYQIAEWNGEMVGYVYPGDNGLFDAKMKGRTITGDFSTVEAARSAVEVAFRGEG